jgi:uncharacterized membrane protein
MKIKPDNDLVDKGQKQYGSVAHIISIISCLIALIAPVLVLMFPQKNMSNPNMIFNAIFEGKKPAEIWETAGVPFESIGFWKLFFDNLFTPDGLAILGIVLGCSITLWALIPSMWQFAKKKDYLYVCISLFIMALISLAMSGFIGIGAN